MLLIAVFREVVRSDMTDQDFLMIAVLLFAVLALMLIPPGPGTPLHEPVPGR
jgi:hypothetical protein